jgi:hypothetical protein
MRCTSCGSENLGKFTGEIVIHLPERNIVFVFPKLAVCLHCGIAQFDVPEAELRLLASATRMFRKPLLVGRATD